MTTQPFTKPKTGKNGGETDAIRKSRPAIPKVHVPLNRDFLIAFFLLLFLLSQAHQLIHHLAGWLISGEVGYLTFDRHAFAAALSEQGVIAATIPGPLVHYAAMWTGMYLLWSGRYSLPGFSLVFAGMPLGRFLASMGGDEARFGTWTGRLLGINDEYSVFAGMLIALLVVLPPLIIAYISLGNRKKTWVFVAYLFLPFVFYLIFCFFPDHTFLVPHVQNAFDTGTPPAFPVTMIGGLPLVLIVVIGATTALFFLRYARHLIPDRKGLMYQGAGQPRD